MAGSTWVMLEKKGSRPGTRSSHAITVVGGTAYSFGGELIPRVPVGSTMYAFDLKTAATPPSAADREKWGREMGYGGGALCSFPFSGSGLFFSRFGGGRSRSRGPLQAVTFAFATVRRFPWRQVPAYVLAQMLGATLRFVFGGRHERFPGTPPAGSEVQSLVLEFIVTFYLMFAISGVAADNRALIPNNLKVSRTQHYVTYHYQLQYLFWRKASAFDGICRNLKVSRT